MLVRVEDDHLSAVPVSEVGGAASVMVYPQPSTGVPNRGVQLVQVVWAAHR